jgi:hypothetical protein
VGDSMLQQTMDSMECEAQRRRLRAQTSSTFVEAMRECGAKAPLALAAPGQAQPAQFFYRGDRIYKPDEVRRAPCSRGLVRFGHAATPKAEPRQQQDWVLKCLQGGRAHPLAACGVATLCCPPPALEPVAATRAEGRTSLARRVVLMRECLRSKRASRRTLSSAESSLVSRTSRRGLGFQEGMK